MVQLVKIDLDLKYLIHLSGLRVGQVKIDLDLDHLSRQISVIYLPGHIVQRLWVGFILDHLSREIQFHLCRKISVIFQGRNVIFNSGQSMKDVL